MALLTADRVKETTTTTGTGTYSLTGAATGFRTFVAGIGTGKKCYYCVEDGSNWEVGIGTVTDAATDTLSRDTILASSNAGAAVNWGAGTRNAFVTVSPRGLTPQFIRIRKTADQTFTNTGETVTWDTEDEDEPAGIDLAGANTKVFTAPGAGLLDITFSARWAADADAERWLIAKRFNSSNTQVERMDNNIYRTDSAAQAQYQVFRCVFKMDDGDYVTLQGFVPGGTIDFDDVAGTLANGGNAAYARGFWWPR